METKTDLRVAKEILNQLGGNKFIAMTGAKAFTGDKDSLTFQISSRNKLNAKYVKIILNVWDTYNLEFYKQRGSKPPVSVYQINGIYNDQLQEIFTRKTGLHTHL